MPQQGLVTSRVVVERNFCLLPPEGIPVSVLPEWTQTEARVLAAPPLGARFAMYLLDIAAGGGSGHQHAANIEGFLYVVDGDVDLDAAGRGHRLGRGGFAYMLPGARFRVLAKQNSRLVWLKKVYKPFGAQPPHDVVGNENELKGEPFMGVEELLLKTLLPTDIAFDMAMNIFTFPPGFSLPITETHIMEHGLYMLQGQGMYYLGNHWMEVKAGDFIWMGPYCPQSFYATGSEPARYIYYKDVNRDVEL
ncbi:MAG: (S)-ureidoglycine aminohydrolase [Candidatus Eisenbacteria bacterium]